MRLKLFQFHVGALGDGTPLLSLSVPRALTERQLCGPVSQPTAGIQPQVCYSFRQKSGTPSEGPASYLAFSDTAYLSLYVTGAWDRLLHSIKCGPR